MYFFYVAFCWFGNKKTYPAVIGDSEKSSVAPAVSGSGSLTAAPVSEVVTDVCAPANPCAGVPYASCLV